MGLRVHELSFRQLTVAFCLFRSVLPGDFKALDAVAKMAVKEKQKFERLEMTKEELLEMFKASR